jgi:exodeoxyribonuclease V gamma subunit
VAGADLDRALEVERARGTLPPGELAVAEVDEVRRTVEQLLDGAREFGIELGAPSRAIAIDVELPDGRRLVGAVDDVVGTTRLAVTFSTLSPGHRLPAWIDLLALYAHDPTTAWQAVTLGKARAGRRRARTPRW